LTIKIETCRHFLEGRGVQVSTEAAAYLALYLDMEAKAIAHKAVNAMEEENCARQIQGLPPRSRLASKDIEKALQGDG